MPLTPEEKLHALRTDIFPSIFVRPVSLNSPSGWSGDFLRVKSVLGVRFFKMSVVLAPAAAPAAAPATSSDMILCEKDVLNKYYFENCI